ncbi:MAG TPA: helix-turn-helix transcriptional regulator [Flavobacterium sp.]|nr:helix-turn-helix transcriptional regulator [Flavobacterium sp.]
MNLGPTIKNLRQQKGLTQTEFALKAGITQTYLSQIENNLKDPNISVLKKLAEELAVPLPIIFFLSIDQTDIAPEKRDAFDKLGQSAKALINEFFVNPSSA